MRTCVCVCVCVCGVCVCVCVCVCCFEAVTSQAVAEMQVAGGQAFCLVDVESFVWPSCVRSQPRRSHSPTFISSNV